MSYQNVALHFTGKAEQMSFFQMCSSVEAGQDDYLHDVQPGVLRDYPWIYDDHDPSKTTGGGICYFAVPDANLYARFNRQKWFAFLESLQHFFLGESGPFTDMSAHEGLPFVDLSTFVRHGGVLGPGCVKRLDADFTNVASDGVDQDYLVFADRYYPDLAEIYPVLRKGVRATADLGGIVHIE